MVTKQHHYLINQCRCVPVYNTEIAGGGYQLSEEYPLFSVLKMQAWKFGIYEQDCTVSAKETTIRFPSPHTKTSNIDITYERFCSKHDLISIQRRV